MNKSLKIKELDVEVITRIEPKQKNRWIVYFPNEFNLEVWDAVKAARPSFNFETMEWDEIKVVYRDRVVSKSTDAILSIIEKIKNKEIDNNFDVKLELLKASADVFETWIINSRLVGVDFDNLSIKSDDFVYITLTIKPININKI